jgi:hypothetical protein
MHCGKTLIPPLKNTVNGSFKCSLLSQIYVHICIIIVQVTAIIYDITLTTLSFFRFSNILPDDITKNPVRIKVQFVFANFEKLLKPRWRRSIFS